VLDSASQSMLNSVTISYRIFCCWFRKDCPSLNWIRIELTAHRLFWFIFCCLFIFWIDALDC